MFYVSFGSEVDTHEMIKEASREKKVAVPKVNGGELIACKIEEDPLRVIDCEVYPTHIDCLEDEDPTDDPTNINYIDIYYMNDFHGSILPDGSEMGFAAISNFLVTKKLYTF